MTHFASDYDLNDRERLPPGRGGFIIDSKTQSVLIIFFPEELARKYDDGKPRLFDMDAVVSLCAAGGYTELLT